jgi:glycosyltransferase involved in cell wall biosynthesis
MKIAMVDEWVAPRGRPFFGGPDSRLISLCQHLKKKNDIHIITSHIEGGERIEDHDGITVHRVGKKRNFTQRGDFLERLKFGSLVASKVKELKPDLVSPAGFVSYEGGYVGAREIGVPSVVTVHEVWLGEWIRNMGLINGVIGHVLERHYLNYNFDGYIAVSNFTKQKLVDKVGVRPDNIEVVYNGIDPEIYRPANEEKFSEPTVLTICRLVGYKRVQDLVRAIGILKDEYPDIRLKIIGIGPMEASLKEMADELKMNGNVEFLGKVAETNQLAEILQKSHVFALPSVAEGFGMVVVEAMASGVPFVASRIPPIEEVTEDGRGGLLFNPTDHEDLADKIRQLLGDSTLAREKALEGAALSERYRWEVLSAHLEEYYRQILSGFEA